ncbi:MAG: DUF5663 domain-containing protein [Candidatus Pacebacteria bacterium]|nr:DUF5663 domain-containing protein [Candidatus Paceibacterota bacterium]
MQLISEKTLQDIEESFGLDLLDKNRKNDIMKEMVSLISSRAGIRIMKELSEDEAKEFNRIPDENIEEMENYLLTKNPNAKEIFEEEAQKTKKELLNTKI